MNWDFGFRIVICGFVTTDCELGIGHGLTQIDTDWRDSEIGQFEFRNYK